MTQCANISESQLRWRCRRGMLELDILLSHFVEIEYNVLTKDEIDLFLTFLDYQDQLLFDLLLEKKVSSDEAISALVTRIRQANCN